MTPPHNRLEGLDLARAMALLGMVLVNFRIAMGGQSGEPPWLKFLLDALEGRSAASFVVLAGIGLGLSTRKLAWPAAMAHSTRRALFLLILGLLNYLVFPADIIHYYAVYFLLGACCLRLPSPWLLSLIPLLAATFVGLLFLFDYDRGWQWHSFSYPEFWTLAGFIRNLLFNGWHPVVPWLGFLLYGLWLSRQPLANPATQHWLLVGGVGAMALAKGLSLWLSTRWPSPELAPLLATQPIPPAPLYLLFGMGIASTLIALCLWLGRALPEARCWRVWLPVGRQALTLYLAHILLGMGTLEAIGWLQGQGLPEVVLVAGLFTLAALLFANLWSKFFDRGPLEWLMRRLCG
ncbi:DUF418 domain-containing protein [Aeromonas bivalvium]|uniref:DUF418 domain-containing protein n=1 Tax=Aeromonas bivalvium TaxID=440079 RepID=UPI0038D0DDD9